MVKGDNDINTIRNEICNCYCRSKEKIIRVKNIVTGVLITQLFLCNTALAAADLSGQGDGGKAVMEIMGTVLKWLQYVGGVVAVVGVVQFILSWQRDDADGKSRAMKVIMSGAMLFGISTMAGKFITTN